MKKRKLYFSRLVKIVSLFSAVLICTAALQEHLLCHYDSNRLRMSGFYIEDENSIDVAFVGASEVYSGFSPGLAYGLYGFTSYPYATASCPSSACITQIKELLKHQSPKLIVFEINSFLYGTDKNNLTEANIRNFIDNVPLNENKIEYISKNIALEDQPEYYAPIIKYHGSWNDYPTPSLKYLRASIAQQSRGFSYLRGYKTKTRNFKPLKAVLNNKAREDSAKAGLTKKSERELREFLDYLKAENIKNILFLRMPHIINQQTYNRFKRTNTAAEIISSYGYDVLNYEKDDAYFGLDYYHDFYNYDHLNLYGSKKFTTYFGKILRDKYNIGPSELNEEQKKEWETSADYYNRYYEYVKDFMIQKPKIYKTIEETPDVIQELDKMT